MPTAPKLLIVEDDADQALLYAQVLEVSGYTIVVAKSAEEAQVRLTAEPFDLLLADWDLGGGMQGDALIPWAKARCPGIKTVLFSNHPEVEDLAVACGADASFRKMDGIVRLRQIATSLVPPPADNA